MLDGILLFAGLFAMAAFVGREWYTHRRELKDSRRRRHEESRRQRIEEYRLWRGER